MTVGCSTDSFHTCARPRDGQPLNIDQDDILAEEDSVESLHQAGSSSRIKADGDATSNGEQVKLWLFGGYNPHDSDTI